MIILLIVIFAALAVIGFFYIPNKSASWTVGVLSIIVLALSIAGLVVHDTQHWGMKKVETTSTETVYTAGPASQAFGMMIKNPMGTKSPNYVLIYRTDENKAAQAHFATKAWDVPKDAAKLAGKLESYMKKNAVEASKKTSTYKLVDSDKAERVVKSTRWEYSSSLMNTLFGIGGDQGELVKQTVTVQVPKNTWLVLTAKQAAQLGKLAPQIAAKQKAAVEAKIAAAPTPEMKEQIAAAAQTQAAQMQEMQKNDPEAYAKLQVKELKQVLGIKD